MWWKRATESNTLDPSVTLYQVLAQEYQAVTGQPAPEDPRTGTRAWMIEDEDILEPQRLSERLTLAPDRSSSGLKNQPLEDSIESTSEYDLAALSTLLKDWLNTLLQKEDLYPEEKRLFDGVRFRSQTLDAIDAGKAAEPFPLVRNRLILEDAFPELEKVSDRRLKRLYQEMGKAQLSALCLSGGGIRSATFALGVVQGLARKGLLDKFHYLSTVSGGGYLGAWLSAWINHTDLPHVVEHLRQPSGRPLEPDPTPIWHLRSYSNYLSPKLGLLSVDTWTLVAIYIRNLFLNWLVLVPPIVGLLAFPLTLVAAVSWTPEGYGPQLQRWLALGLALVAFGCGAAAVSYVHANRPYSPTDRDEEIKDPKRSPREFLRKCLLPLFVAAVFSSISWAWAARFVELGFPPALLPAGFAVIGALLHLAGWLIALFQQRREEQRRLRPGEFLEAIVVLITGGLAGLAGWLVISLLPSPLEYQLSAAVYVWLSVPALLTLILVFHHIYIGYASKSQVDSAREWSARFSGWMLAIIGGWLVALGLVLLGPPGLRWIFNYVRDHAESVLPAVKAVIGAIGVISGAVTLRAGHSAATPGKVGSAPATNWPLALAAPTFIVCLVVLLGWIGSLLVGTMQERPGAPPGSGAAVLVSLGVTVTLIVFGLWTARRVDMNRFSLHAMYRARLIRAYLGASRPAGERDPNPFTGFDEKDNLRLRELAMPQHGGSSGSGHRLLHVVNVALNLVGGKNLAWQQRKAESFTFSPLHCGAKNHGYRFTRRPDGTTGRCYAGDRGPSLGTAITISGAAASPNMGYHSSPIISLLLTLFNIRLGWWLANPGHAGRDVYQQSSTGSSLLRLAEEAFGLTDDKNAYVYLSDGGHFENLGLYEMVLRRCHTIVVSDGGCDPTCAFEDLGNAVRKIRIDLGVPIELSEMKINPRVDGGVALPGKYCAIGRIRYSCVDDGADDGTLIYLKPAFYGSEPKDVYNYAMTSPAFPHESTGDQFFSESQFESYRALGSYVVDQILPDAMPSDDPFMKPSWARLVGETEAYLRRPVASPNRRRSDEVSGDLTDRHRSGRGFTSE